MVKKACYVIIPNAVLYEKYKNLNHRVFKDDDLKWTEVDYVSGYWANFEDNVHFTYQGVMKKLTNIMLDLIESSVSFHLDRHKFFCEILHNMKMGETVFVKYEEATKLVLKKHLKEKRTKVVEKERQIQQDLFIERTSFSNIMNDSWLFDTNMI